MNAQSRQLRKLFLRPAPLQAQLLHQQRGVVSHGERVKVNGKGDHVMNPTPGRLCTDNATAARPIGGHAEAA